MTKERYLQSIRSAYPDLDLSVTEFNEQGQNSDVIVVNRELIFRFPKYPHVLERLAVETRILNAVQETVPLAIPAPAYSSLDRPVGEAFVGYRRIPGEPLWRERFRAIQDPEVVRRVAHQVASFLRALHSFPIAQVGVDIPLHDTRDECADIYARMRAKLFGMMRPDARAWAADHFERFLDDPANFANRPVLKHGDFGPSNILYDSGAGRVTGVIDFGNSGLGDPAYDFAGLLSGYGEPFLERCAELYPAVTRFIGRVRFYQGTFALLEALFGIENGDQEALRAGLATYV